MTDETKDALDEALDAFKATMAVATLSEYERTLVIGNLNGFCAHLREYGTPRRASAEYPDEWLSQFFDFDHLRDSLKRVSSPFHALALSIMDKLPRNPERTVALRKLVESKDAAVRCLVADLKAKGEPL